MIKYILIAFLALILILGLDYQKERQKEYQFYRGLFISCVLLSKPLYPTYTTEQLANGCREAIKSAKNNNWYETPDPIQY